ncbi:dnaJ homolog subfamily C member 21 [Plodia interpunctella]|uniref:dnaJ homolog subfamily C member 21 n=1 Tax=Plodia interpunctella TaxID=58824 RepID=UPI002367AD05|nr:dnaJ homolog subfamily C member 21 [Plodia interpunctella]
MKCHYEVLCLTKEATPSEIKKAYRKLALQWHPDKNLDNLQEAKEQFQLVQNAYEVLSDPQERAWYDNHREQLLRGAGSSYNDDSLDVYPYFSPSCYKGFGDDSQGFYGVYTEVFSKLAAEETDFLDDPEDVSKIPKFGNSTTPYEDVHEFYAYWMSFSTNKSYVWLDQYEIQQGDNRRVIKLMEKENNKLRQKARKERNEEIRRLVSFVRRKDKRVIEHTKLLQEKAEENKKKSEQIRRERILQRQKEIEEAKKKEGESSFLQSEDYQKKLSEIESLLAEEFGISSDDDTISEGGMESSNEESSKTEEASEASKVTPKSSTTKSKQSIKNLYCTACSKLFKNVKSFENHENSKKHKENVANMTLDDGIAISDQDEKDEVIEESNDCGKVNGETEDDKDPVGNSTSEIEDNDIRETLSDDSDKIQALPKSHKKKKNKKKSFIPMAESEGNDSHDEMSFNEIEGPSRSRKAKKFNMLKSQIQAKKEANLKKGSQSQTSTENLYEVSSTTPTDDALGDTALPKDRPALPKMQRNIKPKKMVDRKPMRTKTSETEDSSTALNLRCAVCQSDFSSKNKLFDHLKSTGHSVPLPQTSCSHSKKNKRANR